jgi:hypothetical protein
MWKVKQADADQDKVTDPEEHQPWRKPDHHYPPYV